MQFTAHRETASIKYSLHDLILDKHLGGESADTVSTGAGQRGVAVATLILADDELVVTDLSRTPEDYAAMGLPVYEASLHYPQEDGYVHAMDLRTMGRPGWRNMLTQNYFRLLGLRTLRHVGTADHLHVSLPPR